MGTWPSRPPPENGFNPDNKRTVFRPPPEPNHESEKMNLFRAMKKSNSRATNARLPEYIPPQYSSRSNAREVSRCAGLLRQMYTLDLEIWAMSDAHEDEIPERIQKERKANALFLEIKRIVEDWTTSGHWRWEPEERQCVEDICAAIKQHGTRRY